MHASRTPLLLLPVVGTLTPFPRADAPWDVALEAGATRKLSFELSPYVRVA